MGSGGLGSGGWNHGVLGFMGSLGSEGMELGSERLKSWGLGSGKSKELGGLGRRGWSWGRRSLG